MRTACEERFRLGRRIRWICLDGALPEHVEVDMKLVHAPWARGLEPIGVAQSGELTLPTGRSCGKAKPTPDLRNPLSY
jgi:hypothetical protein